MTDFTLNFASEGACLVPVEKQDKPEQWHKLTTTLRRSQVLEGVRFNGGFRGGRIFRRIFNSTDFSADFLADFSADFSPDFSADFAVDFSVDLAWDRRWIFLKKVRKPCKTKDLSDLLQIPAQILPGCGSLLFSGCAGLTRISPPPHPPQQNPPECWGGWEACHHANAKR